MRPWLSAAICWAVLAAPAAAAPNARPDSVPALDTWRGASGTFVLRRDARIVVRARDRAALLGEARVLAADVRELTGRPVGVTARRGARARAGDVVLGRTNDPALGDEGYRLRIGRSFDILAPGATGAFYGGRTLLQLVRGGVPIPRGRARDVPLYPERALMIDNGRVFYSRAWLEQRIEELAALKLNILHLHISDNQGFRIESTSHPEAVTPPFLTQADIRRLVQVARRNHVTLVPEIDAPGHMQAALRAHPEFQLVNSAGQRQPDKLDVANPAARQFVFDLVDELAPLFPGPYWHTGADEYLGVFSTAADYQLHPQLEAYAEARYGAGANGKDAVIDFVNEIALRVRERHAKSLRIWSDGVGGGSVLTVDTTASVMWWEEQHSPSPEQLARNGHRVLNAGWWPNYYVTGGPLEGLRAPVEQAYENWDPSEFSGPYTRKWVAGPDAAPSGRLPRGSDAQLGASLQVWNDDPASPDAAEPMVAAGIAPRLRVLSQKAWGSPPLTRDYDDFEERAVRVTTGE